MRIGHGFDAHRFGGDAPLVIGGVTIPHDSGLIAHSDGDVLIHALCDALLGAAGQGDIGRHFPDSSDEFKAIDSRILLRRVVELLQQSGFGINNADVTLIAQQPRMAAHIDAMIERLSADLQVAEGRLNIKATTTEKMGYTGRSEGVACHVVVLLVEQAST